MRLWPEVSERNDVQEINARLVQQTVSVLPTDEDEKYLTELLISKNIYQFAMKYIIVTCHKV
jgi:hypothetical protein